MRKLLLLASAMVIGFATQASSYAWGFNGYNYVDSTGAGYNGDFEMNLWDGGKAFLFLGAVTASDSAFDFSSATFITSSTFDSTYLVYGNDGTEGMSASDLVQSTESGQAFSLILVDDTLVSDSSLSSYKGNYVLYVGSSEEGTLPGATVSHYAAFMNGSPVAQSDWQTMGASPIPEPTSGLLMLLGMAGLALKRKHA